MPSSIDPAIPTDHSAYDYRSKHNLFGGTNSQACDYTEELAVEMLATTRNDEFDADKPWGDEREADRLSSNIVRTINVT